MEVLKRINFDREIPPFSFSEFETKFLNANERTPIRLNEIELKNVMGAISLFQINNEIPKGKGGQKLVLDTLIKGNNNFLNNNLNYIIKLIPQLDQCYKEDFENLLDQTYNKDTLFDNDKLHDFCSDAIVDTIFFERLWEFGLYNIHKMSNEVFKDLNIDERKEFVKKNIRTIDLTKAVIDGLKKINTSLLEPHIKLLITLFDYQIHKGDFGMKRALISGHKFFQFNMNYFFIANDIRPEMKLLVQTIITNERNNNRNRNQGLTW